MKYGIREICDVVLKAKSKQKIGNKIFYKDEPVCYFDSLKTSSLEGAATTVYAQGGRGNSRLVAWEGERTVTFTMEDALISTEGLALLTGAGIIEPVQGKKERLVETTIFEGIWPNMYQEALQVGNITNNLEFRVNNIYLGVESDIQSSKCSINKIKASFKDISYGEVELKVNCDDFLVSTDYEEGDDSEQGYYLYKDADDRDVELFIDTPIKYDRNNELEYAFFIQVRDTITNELTWAEVRLEAIMEFYEDKIITPASYIQVHTTEIVPNNKYEIYSSIKEVRINPEKTPSNHTNAAEIYVMPLINGEITTEPYLGKYEKGQIIVKSRTGYTLNDIKPFEDAQAIMLDYYVDMDYGVQQIEITPDKFGGNFYLEASTLFRDTNGVDMPAEFIIPNCKIQSNFTFSMASSGDPSTFTFTMDAFPDYTRFDKTKKVLSVIQVITDSEEDKNKVRQSTDSSLTETK